MVSLLDNAAPGGLLADPRPAILAQLFDMSVKKRPTFLPMFRQQNGRIGLTAPQLLVDVVNSAMLPYAAAQGYRATPTDVSKMALDTMLGGGLLGRAPSGAFGANAVSRGPKLTQQQFDDVFLSRSKQRQKWGAERKAEREDLIRQVVETQRQRGVNSALGAPPPLREGPREFEDPLITAAKTREFRAERLRRAKPYADMGQGLWSKSFQKEVNKSAAAPDLFDVGSAINRANMEAVPRALKKEGWTIRHTSKGRDGRVSSRYLVSPDESYEIRLTDHYLPETAERFHRMTQGQGPRWNDEIVLEGDERPMDIIEQIKSGFKGLLD
jgi:hypothetical protein